MSAKPVVAVLGTGSIGTRHLGVVKSFGAKAVAVPLRRERRAELEGEGWDTASDLEGARAEGAGAVIIATESVRHARDAAEAFHLGMAVLCEKPMATTAQDARAMATAAEAKGLPLFVACCLRFDEGLQRFRARLPELGSIHSARAECRSYLPDWRRGRDYRDTYAAHGPRHGILLDIIHEVDYACWCFGVPEAVSGRFSQTWRLGLEGAEAAEAHWAISSGGIVSVGLDYLTRQSVRFARAAGGEGELTYDFIARTLTFREAGGAIRQEDMEGERADMYPRQLAAFLCAMESGHPGSLGTAKEGVISLQVCEAWAKSTSTRSEEFVL
jgi:predicted dehydrogenase